MARHIYMYMARVKLRKLLSLIAAVLIVYLLRAHFTHDVSLQRQEVHEPNATKIGDYDINVGVADQEISHSEERKNRAKASTQSLSYESDELKLDRWESEEGQEMIDKVQERQLLHVDVPELIFNKNGAGYYGSAVKVEKTKLDWSQQILFEEGYKRHDFNEYVSNLISVDRRVPDVRDPVCASEKYPDDLPDTSVIITFLNEAWSVLVRTVHSIIKTSPPHLLREIILVDDFSDYDYLQEPLKDYMKRFPKVKIVRNKKREGLIRSRLIGATHAKGEVLTFFDSHIECVTDWLQPMLARVKEDPCHVVWPVIPTIDRHTFRFDVRTSTESVSIGTFTWELTFAWGKSSVFDRETPTSPVRSPTMAGGLFSIDREFFYKIGSYDDQMYSWGGENLELSFRIWMCGGTIEVIPCSIVGHIYRDRNVNMNNKAVEDMKRNLVRTAVVWMDEYKRIYSMLTMTKLRNFGDISDRLQLRKDLKCKSFQWYLENISPNVFIPAQATKYGMIQSVFNPSLCFHAADNKHAKLILNRCSPMETVRQIFYIDKQQELRHLSTCVDAGKPLMIMMQCHRLKGTQQFEFRSDKTIYHPRRRRCLELKKSTVFLELNICDNLNTRQQWVWKPTSLNFLHLPEVN